MPYVLSYCADQLFRFALLSSDSGLVDKDADGWDYPAVDWYSSPEPWRVIFTLVNLWKNAGFWSIVYLAGMLAISPEYYEAARMDGASGWRRSASITLPLARAADHYQRAAEHRPYILCGLWSLLSGARRTAAYSTRPLT